ncbi:Endoglucanase ii [Colletotrichum higginsianum IMI 349063]|uniref:Endoglucanase ii n=2 Tax=Colletotrichum higginsianum TaxID=80884 RepID=A0A1B7YWT1_COLHI|nr:Endoglucanase ii [Colletotrichum higginsianum IMI 349063]OBR16424.1 Endoglucanase ii [Colletotrichum higginsianum IMI 349063]TID03805.1 hypothetical protein CH35J_001885 [Colletotrichum higginsianum]
MSYSRRDFRDEYPPRRHHHHTPAYSDYSSRASDYSPTRDLGAVTHTHHATTRRSQDDLYEIERNRPRARDLNRGYEEQRPHPRSRSNHDTKHRHGHESHRDHGRSSKRRSSSSGANLTQAAVAAASAGIIEAGLARHDRDRTARVLTAAAGAGAIDAVAARKHEKPHRQWEHVVGSTVGGLVVNRVAHGSRRHH